MVEAGQMGGGHQDGDLKKSPWVLCPSGVQGGQRARIERPNRDASRQVITAGSVHRCTRKISGAFHRSLLRKGSDGRENHA